MSPISQKFFKKELAKAHKVKGKALKKSTLRRGECGKEMGVCEKSIKRKVEAVIISGESASTSAKKRNQCRCIILQRCVKTGFRDCQPPPEEPPDWKKAGKTEARLTVQI